MQQQYHTHAHTHTNTHTHTRRRARDVCWFSCRLSGARPLTLSLCRLRAAVRVSGPCRCAPPRKATVALGLETMAEQLPSPLPPSSRSAPPLAPAVCVCTLSIPYFSYRDYVPCPPFKNHTQQRRRVTLSSHHHRNRRARWGRTTRPASRRRRRPAASPTQPARVAPHARADAYPPAKQIIIKQH